MAGYVFRAPQEGWADAVEIKSRRLIFPETALGFRSGGTLRALLPMMAGLFLVAAPATWAYPSYNTDPIAPDSSGMENTAPQLAGKIQAGWNIGNTLEATGGEASWGNPAVTSNLIHLVKQSGFDAIRIPCSWDQYANQGTAEISASWLNRVREVVQYCVDEDLYVILNIHWDGGWLENNCTVAKQVENNARQQAYWEQIATHLRDFDEHLIFASANEPNVDDATQMAVLMSYHQTFIDAVRSTGGRNAYRVLVVQGPRTDLVKTDNLMNSMPVDPVPNRMMLEVHYYTPWQFCGMTSDETWGNQFYYWGDGYHSTTDPSHNATWGEEDDLDYYFSLMKTKFVDQGIPVVLGEYGAIRRTSLTGAALSLHLASRVHFHDYVTEQCNANGFLPFYWDNGYTSNHQFGIFDRWSNTVFDQQVLEALTLIDTEQYWTSHGDDYADAPAAPTALSAEAGDAQVDLSWLAASGATSYRLSRNTDDGGSYITVATNIVSTNYTDTGLTNGTTYYYVVSAANAGGESTNSAVASATPHAVVADPASTPIPGDGASGIALSTNLIWAAGAHADSHRIFFGYDSNTVATATTNSTEFMGSQAGLVYDPGELAASGRFYWRVDEITAGGMTTTGPVWTFATVIEPIGGTVAGEVLPGGSSFNVSFSSSLGQTYLVEWTGSLVPASWTTVSNNIPGTGGTIDIQDPSMTTQRFYRVILLDP